MFSKDQSEISSQIFIENGSPESFFEAIKQRNLAEIRRYFRDISQKVWTYKEEDDYTALHRSVFMNSEPITSLIIEELKKRFGLDNKGGLEKFINETTNEGITALHYAAYNGNINIANMLIDNGADVGLISKRGKNVMHFAAEGNKPSIMVYFIAYHAQDVFCIDECGSTPLHWACYSGSEEAVLFLLSVKANINAKDKEGLTPLHLCALSKRNKIILTLLQQGADKYILNNKQQTAYDIAKKNLDKKSIALLEDKDYNPLCTLETPIEAVEGENVYKYVILGWMIIVEVALIIGILPFIDGYTEVITNASFFIPLVLSYVLIINKKTAKIPVNQLIRDQPKQNPLKILVDNNIDIIGYCPYCCVTKANNRKHCFVCNKCIEGFDHHCFWLNKCIGKGNCFFYICFLFFISCFSLHSVYASTLGFVGDIYVPEEKIFPPRWLAIGLIDRRLMILFSAIVFVLAIIVTFPSICVLFLQIAKWLGLFKIIPKTISKRNSLGDINLNNDKVEFSLVEHKNDKLIEEKDDEEDDDNKYDRASSLGHGGINRVTDSVISRETKQELDSNVIDVESQNQSHEEQNSDKKDPNETDKLNNLDNNEENSNLEEQNENNNEQNNEEDEDD